MNGKPVVAERHGVPRSIVRQQDKVGTDVVVIVCDFSVDGARILDVYLAQRAFRELDLFCVWFERAACFLHDEVEGRGS